MAHGKLARTVPRAAGNAALYPRPGVECRPVTGLSPAELAVVWRADTEDDPAVAAFLAALPSTPDH